MTSTKPIVSTGDNLADRAHKGVVSTAWGQGSARRVASRTLFLGDREIEIEHNGALYRLRQTSLGKLILTK